MDSVHRIPPAIVLDVGIIAGRGWSVIEANGAWGAGLYGCGSAIVLSVIRHAAPPTAQHWVRPRVEVEG